MIDNVAACHEPLARVFWFHVYNERLVHSPQIVCLRSASYMITESARRTDVIMASTMETQKFIIRAFRRANTCLTLLYRVTHKKVYLFRRILYPNYVITKLKEFYIDKHIFRNTAWICLRFVCKQLLKRVICIRAVFCLTAQL